MKKEELLQKGISEEVADEIIASFTDNETENSLLALKKAVGKGADESTLFKAAKKTGGDDDDEGDDDEYDEAYMKKHMSRYMKENKKNSQEMKKASSTYEGDMQGAVEELAGADAAYVETGDLMPCLKAQEKATLDIYKAISDISERIGLIESQNLEAYKLMSKAAQLQVDQAEGLEQFLSASAGKKGVTSNVDLKKAGLPAGQQLTKEQNGQVWQTLYKAVRKRDEKACEIISRFESVGHDTRFLTPPEINYIQELIKQEEK
jgi:hypothetical protein